MKDSKPDLHVVNSEDESTQEQEDTNAYGVTLLQPETEQKQSRLSFFAIFLVVLLVLALILAFILGLNVGKQNSDVLLQLGFPVASENNDAANKEKKAHATDLSNRVVEAAEMLSQEALNSSSLESNTAGAITGMLAASNDRYAQYYDPAHFKMFQEENAGEFGGIGVVLADKDGKAYISKVYENTPASNAGLAAGDYIVAINGEKREPWTVEDVAQTIRGEAGKTFTLSWVSVDARGQVSEEKTAKLTTEKIEYPVVHSKMLENKVGLIQIDKFNSLSEGEVAKAINQLTREGAQGFILDLRGNPGGLLDQAVAVSSHFIKRGGVVEVESKNGARERKSVSGQQLTDKPLVVLIDGDSASTTEIVSSAIQDHERGLLVGDLSFGKGTVQVIEQFSFGGGMKFTIAHYLTANGNPVDQLGVLPDLVVPMDKSLRNVEGQDIQMQKAQELVNKIIASGGNLSVEGLSNAPGSQAELTTQARDKRNKELEALELKLKEAQAAILTNAQTTETQSAQPAQPSKPESKNTD